MQIGRRGDQALTPPEWKWLLQQMGDRDLIKVARRLKLRLPGWQGARWAQDFGMARPRVVQALLKGSNFVKLRKALDQWVQQDRGLQQLRASSEEQLHQRLADGYRPGPMLMSLLSSPDPKLKQRASSLFDHLRFTGALSDWLAMEQRPEQAESASTPTSAREQESWPKERLQLNQTIEELRAELAEVQVTAIRNQQLWEVERQSLLSRLADRDTRLQLRERQLAELKAEEQPTEEVALNLAKKQLAPLEGVVLVGNIAPSQAKLLSSHGLQCVLPLDVLQGTAGEAVDRAQQVWMLSYATPLPIQRQLMQTAASRLSCFTSYDQLQDRIEGEGVPK